MRPNPKTVAARYLRASFTEGEEPASVELDPSDVLVQLAYSWMDEFLDLLEPVRLTVSDIEAVLEGADIEALNDAYVEETGVDRTAGAAETVQVAGGKLLKGAWHALTGPITSIWKLLKSKGYRAEIKKSLLRVIHHEVRATRHLIHVAVKLSKNEPVSKHEMRMAAVQFVDLASKAIMIWFIGPHVAHFLSSGVTNILLSLISPFDDLAGILLDRPLRWVSKKFLGRELGLLPGGFYTHF